MARLFVAVWPTVDLVDQLRRLERPARSGLRWTTADQWHVTLRFLGRVGPDDEEAARSALASTAVPVPMAVAGPQPRSLGASVWMLPVAGLEDTAGAVAEATSGIGEPAPSRPFRGHLTLARARSPAALRGLPAPTIEASWPVPELTLVSSDTHPDGARYQVVGRWALPAG